jgi:AcrR family transcriptional regulator
MLLGMPHPSQIDPSAITATARQLLAERGPDGVVMREVARRLGVSAPSLYFHVPSRQALLDQLIDVALEELGAALHDESFQYGRSAMAHHMADAYVDFALANQRLFALVFGPCGDERPFDGSGADLASRALFEMVARLVPEAQVLPVAQVFWSLVHGFATLIAAGQFRMPGDPRSALHDGVDLLLGGLGRRD